MVAISEGSDTHNEKAVKTRWPVEEGLEAGTNKQTGKRFLSPEVSSKVSSKDKVGL
tara:strand:- start:786 stop:953 length:168 start_codon:yes stop_codon:yes gene_type:complete